MSKIVDYKLVRTGANNLSGLEDSVKALIKEGWQPVGELKEANIDVQRIFVQAMVKHDD